MASDSTNARASKDVWHDKIMVSIRQEVRSSAYRAALSNPLGCAGGFLLGNTNTFKSPAIEFSLLSGIPSSVDECLQMLDRLRFQLKAAKQTAKTAGVSVVGLFLAQDTSLGERRHQLTGLYMETAVELQLPYVIVFSTTGFETLWAPQCYFANNFPHDALSYRMIRGKLSIQPKHNPRRVRLQWRQFRADSSVSGES